MYRYISWYNVNLAPYNINIFKRSVKTIIISIFFLYNNIFRKILMMEFSSCKISLNIIIDYKKKVYNMTVIQHR